VIPHGGVYVTATLVDGQWRRSVTNIGTRPTFESGSTSSVETYVMNWSGDLYGDVVRVRFLHRLRDEKKFGSIDELTAQIERDVARAGEFLKRVGVRRSLVIE
jgi:riboflavin kinase/FMN adenylyltransferase